LSEKLVPTFADRGVSRSQRVGEPYIVSKSYFQQNKKPVSTYSKNKEGKKERLNE
jgi:hypothetical protein